MGKLNSAGPQNQETVKQFTTLSLKHLRTLHQVLRDMGGVGMHLLVDLEVFLLWVFETSLRLHWINNSINCMLGHLQWDTDYLLSFGTFLSSHCLSLVIVGSSNRVVLSQFLNSAILATSRGSTLYIRQFYRVTS